MKLVRIGFGLIAGAAVLGAAYLWTPAPAPFDAAAALEAARAYDARIIRDKFGVPHIYGARDVDVAFGLAYAHAEDDYKTLEDVVSFSRGRLGLRTGKDGAITDYLVAALNVQADLDAKYKTDLTVQTRAVLEAYAAGVNLYCAQEKKRCAPGAAPVTGRDVAAGFVSRTPFFYGLEEQLTALFRDDKVKHASLQRARTAFLDIPRSFEVGSNAMAVAPSRSADGHTRLMVNSHQPYTGPVAWYEARLKSDEGWDRIGGVFPGAPMILHGAGPDNGWALTVNKPDLVDVYALEVDRPKRPAKYRFDGGWRDFERSSVKIRVKLAGPFSLPVTREVLRSVHGPAFVTPKGVFAVSYGGQGDIRAAEQWFAMNKARDFASWRTAMEIQGIPSFNVVYADRTGRIGYFYNAAIPVRAARQDWTLTADGADPELVWKGVRPFGSAPQIVDPASGYVVNANNNPYESSAPEDSPKAVDYPPEYGIDMKTTNRGLREQELYGADTSITAEEFVGYKMDHFFSKRSRLAVLIDGLIADEALSSAPETKDEIALLKSWDLSAAQESRAAALAIRTGRLALGWYLSAEFAETPDPRTALIQASSELKSTFGRIDPTWGEAMRLTRGAVDLSINGAMETLRAVYPDDDHKRGRWTAAGGDTYILYADWAPDGAQSIRTIHQFGSATRDARSPHYADQAGLFAAEDWKSPPMSLDVLLAEASADYRPVEGGRPNAGSP